MIQDRPKIAFDLGGVIVHRQALQNHIVEQSFMSVKLTVQKFGANNVYVISKAKQKYIQRNIDLLTNHKFFELTGMKLQNIHFVNEYQDKAIKMKQFNITYILDDSIKIAKDCKENGLKPILFGDHQEFVKGNPQYVYVRNWKAFRKLLQKIPN